jgi:hypothetical protein
VSIFYLFVLFAALIANISSASRRSTSHSGRLDVGCGCEAMDEDEQRNARERRKRNIAIGLALARPGGFVFRDDDGAPQGPRVRLDKLMRRNGMAHSEVKHDYHLVDPSPGPSSGPSARSRC